ncbi:aspartate/glutamate racemase family protein [Dermabacteraceae bacterium P13128]
MDGKVFPGEGFVGVLGGVGPAATALFMDLLVRATDSDTDQGHINALVTQHAGVPDRTAHILNPAGSADPGPVLAADARFLEQAGAEFLVLPCNTAHHYSEAIESGVGIELVSIVAATAEAAREAAGPGGKVAIFATEGNINAGVYQDALDSLGVGHLVPDAATQAAVNELIYDQVKAGRPVDNELFLSALRTVSGQGADAVILGCTELSVIYDREGYRAENLARAARGLPFLVDSLSALVRATVARAAKPLRPGF